MRKTGVILICSAVILTTLACNFPMGSGTEKIQPVNISTSGWRSSFSGDYSCSAEDAVTLNIDQDGVAMLSVTGVVYMDYINCKVDPGFTATFILIGLADPDTQEVDFKSCNENGYAAEGSVSYINKQIRGRVLCKFNKGENAGKVKMVVSIPPD